MEILWKGTVGVCVTQCVFPQNFHTMKLGEITVFYAVIEDYEDLTGYIITKLYGNSFWLVFCRKAVLKIHRKAPV